MTFGLMTYQPNLTCGRGVQEFMYQNGRKLPEILGTIQNYYSFLIK